MQYYLDSIEATERLARKMAPILAPPCIVYLQGDLGAGKTTFVRALLNALGFKGKVKSPTYTILESYHIAGTDYCHFDLYRLNSALELEAMGIQDYLHANSVCLFEWPDKGAGVLPEADLSILLSVDDDLSLGEGRVCQLLAHSTVLHTQIADLNSDQGE